MMGNKTKKLNINQNKCVACGRCINFCPVGALYKENKELNVDERKCIACGKCTKECPFLALSLEEK